MSDYRKASVLHPDRHVLRMDDARIAVLRYVVGYGAPPLGSENTPTRYAQDNEFIEPAGRRSGRLVSRLTDLGERVLAMCDAGHLTLEHAGMEALRDERGRRVLRHIIRAVSEEAEAA